jgi:hypothetical protein
MSVMSMMTIESDAAITTMNDLPRELRFVIIICLPCPSVLALVSTIWAAMFAGEPALRAILDAAGRRTRRHLLAHLARSDRKISDTMLCKYILYQPRLIAHVGDEGFITIPHGERLALINYIAWDEIIITAVQHSCHDLTQFTCRSVTMPFHWVLYKCKHSSYLENVLDMLMWLDPLHYVQFSSLSARYIERHSDHLTPALYSDKLSIDTIARYSASVDWAVVSARADITTLLVDFADKLDWAVVCRGGVIGYIDDSHVNQSQSTRGLSYIDDSRVNQSQSTRGLSYIDDSRRRAHGDYCKYCQQCILETNHKHKPTHVAAVKQFHVNMMTEQRRRNAARQKQYGADDDSRHHHWCYDI